MIKKIGAWIKRHPIWSAIIGLVTVFIAYNILKPAQPEYEYLTDTVVKGDIVRNVSASGKLRALNTINVGAEVSGQITKVYVDYNSPVTKGQVLAVIDPTRVGAQVNQGEAQVALAQAGLQQAQANAEKARSDLALQQRNFARRKALADKGFLSKADLDLAETQLIAARNAVQVTQTQINSSRAQIRQAGAQLSSSRLDLNRTNIVAPASGVIINKLVEPGTTVAASFQTPNLFEIAADITKMQVEASVDEADIGQVKEGQNVTFTVDSYPDDIFKAKVRQVRQAPVESQNVVSYLVIIDVDNLEGKLLPGMTANIEIITGSKSNVTRVPSPALRFRPRAADRETQDNGGEKKPDKQKRQALVYVATNDPYKPKARIVTIGVEGDEYTEVISGLKPGEKVLTRTKSLKPKTEAEADADTGEDDSAS
ncbi:efflux RND transporter periplasmic adaptor subunit [Sphingorhabdus arenilitoris]|uniref:Efflux RND transporter periplasmic adaptor subunit n=1 Tax=Sphingorhabdus arenilitoris TaxID=1490041 RepID=A0ABV8RHR8_9SPHN